MPVKEYSPDQLQAANMDQSSASESTPPPSMLQRGLNMAGDVLTGAGKGALHTVSSLDDWMRAHGPAFMTNTNMGFGPPADLEKQRQMATPTNTAQKIGYGGEQAAEFLIPGAGEEAGAAKLASMAPKLGKAALPLAKVATSAIGSGLVNKAQGGNFSTGAMMGAGGQVVGQGLKAAAPALAEGALKVRGNQRLFGRTVGDAILNDTKGIRPETIGKSAQETMSNLGPELDAADQASANAGKRGSLVPARMAVADTINGHTANRAMNTAASIQPVSDFLSQDQLTQLPLAAQQTAPGLRAMKRGLNQDFINNWSLEQPPAQKGAARQAYGMINSQLHDISPETVPIDQRISSLIPVALQGQRVASGAPLAQRVAGRIGAHTGAAAMGIGGAIEGRREGGTPGMIAGGLAGLIAPELISSPEGQMALARTLNTAKGLKPLIGTAAQFTRKKDDE